jgi:hypothetical protein
MDENLPRAQIAPLLREILAACERFDPVAATPVLDALAAHLPAARLAPLRQAIEEFDVTAGATAVHELAENLAIHMED